jgi:hypothetical protein
MSGQLLLAFLIGFFTILFTWAFRILPSEGWQILATIPSRKEDGVWRGVNLTYYGFFNATACVFSATVLLLLATSIKVPVSIALLLVGLVLLVCVPASRVMAGLIEGKRYTFTVAGASLIGFLVLPLAIYANNNLLAVKTGNAVALTPFLAAAAIALAFGESLGRLACISFGCCYGRSLEECHWSLRRLFRKHHFVFAGETKKVSYEADLAGLPVIPIQAVTAVVSALAGLAGVWLFLDGHWTGALLAAVIGTQGWRVLSEFLRADFRGGGLLSGYQLMALSALCFTLLVVPILPESPTLRPDLSLGVSALQDLRLVLSLETTWLLIFLYFGRSMVTSARLSFHVERKRV